MFLHLFVTRKWRNWNTVDETKTQLKKGESL